MNFKPSEINLSIENNQSVIAVFEGELRTVKGSSTNSLYIPVVEVEFRSSSIPIDNLDSLTADSLTRDDIEEVIEYCKDHYDSFGYNPDTIFLDEGRVVNQEQIDMISNTYCDSQNSGVSPEGNSITI